LPRQEWYPTSFRSRGQIFWGRKKKTGKGSSLLEKRTGDQKLKIADRSSRAPTFQKIARRQDGEHEVNWCGGNQKKDAAKTTSFVFVVVLGALVLGCAMGASGKEKMEPCESEWDVSRADEPTAMQLQVTPLLRTDRVANPTSTHDSETRES
jgi:hypothetical protein